MNRIVRVLAASAVAFCFDTQAAEAPPRIPSMEERNRMLRESQDRETLLLKIPEYREAMKEQHKLMLARQYPDLEQDLGLNARQFDQMLALLAERQLRQSETLPFDPARTDPQEFNRQFLQQQQWDEAELAALIGARGLQAWKNYQSTLGVRQQVRNLGSMLAASGVPLQQNQVELLLTEMTRQHEATVEEQRAEIQKEYENDLPRRPGTASAVVVGADPAADYRRWQERSLRHMGEYHQRMREAVASVLNPQQLRLVELEQESRMKMQESHLRAQRAQSEATARGEIPPAGGGGLSITPPQGILEVAPR